VRVLTGLAGALALAVALAACGSSSDAGSGSDGSTTAASAASAPAAANPFARAAGAAPARVPGAPLDTVLRVPARARGRRAPLVVALHFASGTGSEMEQATRLTPEARRDGFVVAYPSASENNFWSADGDFDRVMRTIDAVQRVACVDPSRVYAVGISNGGYMSTVLACRAADRIAAVVLFAPGINGIGDCAPARPLSVLEIHGTADPIVPYRNSSGRPDEDIPAFIAAWARRDSCASRSEQQRVSAVVTHFRWPGCRGGARVEHLRLTGGKHIELLPQLRDAGVDPARTAWQFLAAHRLPAR
jgi:polyhydroxybutyrate depolymerase